MRSAPRYEGLRQQAPGYTRNEGISFNMEQPSIGRKPETGARFFDAPGELLFLPAAEEATK